MMRAAKVGDESKTKQTEMEGKDRPQPKDSKGSHFRQSAFSHLSATFGMYGIIPPCTRANQSLCVGISTVLSLVVQSLQSLIDSRIMIQWAHGSFYIT